MMLHPERRRQYIIILVLGLLLGFVAVMQAYRSAGSHIDATLKTETQTAVRLLQLQTGYLRDYFALVATGRIRHAMTRTGLPVNRSALADELLGHAEKQKVFDVMLLSPEGEIVISGRGRPWQGQNINTGQLEGSRELARVIHGRRIRFDNAITFQNHLSLPEWADLAGFPLFGNRKIGFMIYPLAGDVGKQHLGIAAGDLRGYLLVALSAGYFADFLVRNHDLPPEVRQHIITNAGTPVVSRKHVRGQPDIQKLAGFENARVNDSESQLSYPLRFELRFAGVRPWYAYSLAARRHIDLAAADALADVLLILLPCLCFVALRKIN